MKNIFFSLILLLILTFINIIGEKFKILVDLKNPKITWDSEYTMMKQNTNIMYELFYTLVVIGILILISFSFKNLLLFLLFVLIFVIIVNTVINEYMYVNQKKLLKRII